MEEKGRGREAEFWKANLQIVCLKEETKKKQNKLVNIFVNKKKKKTQAHPVSSYSNRISKDYQRDFKPSQLPFENMLYLIGISDIALLGCGIHFRRHLSQHSTVIHIYIKPLPTSPLCCFPGGNYQSVFLNAKSVPHHL